MMRALPDAILGRRADALAALLRRAIGERATVLDVGSGTGHNALALASLGHRVVTVDRVLLSWGRRPDLLCDGGSLPFARESFELALLSSVLSYAARPEVLLRECRRVAGRVLLLQSTFRPGPGRLALALREALWTRAGFAAAALVGLVPRRSGEALRVQRVFTSESLLALVARSGLRLEERFAGLRFRFGGEQAILVLR